MARPEEYGLKYFSFDVDFFTDEKIEACVHLLREKNDKATIISTPWDQLGKEAIQHALHAGAEIEGLFEDKEGHGHHDKRTITQAIQINEKTRRPRVHDHAGPPESDRKIEKE